MRRSVVAYELKDKEYSEGDLSPVAESEERVQLCILGGKGGEDEEAVVRRWVGGL